MTRPSPAIFVADAPGLDFLNSIATPVDEPVDAIHDGEGLLDWLAQSGMVPADVLVAMRDAAMPGELDRLAAQARSLREWFAGFVRKHMGESLPAAALDHLETLNRLLARDEAFERIVADGDALRVERTRRWGSPESLLMPIAEAMAALVTTEDFSHVKACEGPTCTLLFADHTRGHARRWCSMASCGNRAKQAAHRERLKSRT
ncbi:Conserved protein containing a Zn-ribbon-like motif, possibly RNA-binding [Luteibacter sp. UNCMF331Sha3.1]|uniref:CGNR zinc finger domain-containing protein n=1 Tax=Luteibacter sp. UNCMF331Sha3.1 TaxID=1502760 RepID=UPI0008BD2F6E|nr:ABATE domain-containing protein [Luteibacter sp. UNCMF331Sha3.1]SEM53312.1 Conserved protein containing a Zn-ribbon-like motif, possibly RNA-binding [Luteibacter sp. UNCMF331Sha3.1]